MTNRMDVNVKDEKDQKISDLDDVDCWGPTSRHPVPPIWLAFLMVIKNI